MYCEHWLSDAPIINVLYYHGNQQNLICEGDKSQARSLIATGNECSTVHKYQC